MTGVMGRVTAGMFSPAGLRTVRRPGPARHRGEDHGGPAVTGELRETDIVTAVAVASVTIVLAVVKAAGQEFVTDERTGMLQSDAAELATLVSPAAPLLLTSPPTAGIVSPAGHLGTGQVLVHEATATSDTGGEGTGGAGTQVTVSPALVGS